MDVLPKRLKVPNDQMEVLLQGLLIGQLLALRADMGDALAQAANARLKLRFFNQPLRITIDQSGQALTKLA